MLKIIRSRRGRRLAALTSLTLICIAGSAWQHANGEAPHDRKNIPEAEVRLVRTLTVEPKSIADARRAVGEIRPQHESDLGFRLAGKLVTRVVDIGASVKKGQVLGRLEDQDYRNRLLSAKADVAAAEAVLVEAKAAEARAHGLLQKNFTSRANYEATVKSLGSASAKMDSANVALRMAEDQLAYTELKAEFDGIVTKVGAEAGQSVNVGQMVVRVADPSMRDAVFSISETAFGKDAPTGQVQEIMVSLLSNPEIKTTGHLREISPIADPATRTFEVKVSLDNPPEAMRFGSSVAGRLDTPSKPVVVLPGSALFDKDSKPAVWVVTEKSRVALKPVVVTRYETDRVVVSGGLAKGDIVITAGVNRLREDQRVRLEEGDVK